MCWPAWPAQPLAIPPGYASPLYPAAGVALAFVLIYGWRMLPAVALAALCVSLSVPLQRGVPFNCRHAAAAAC